LRGREWLPLILLPSLLSDALEFVHSAEEAGQYLATYKRFEHKPPNMIKERVEREPSAIMRAALTGISRVNKTDVETLRTSFGSFSGIACASAEQLAQLPGFGPKKVARLKDAFDRPFRTGARNFLQDNSTQVQDDQTGIDSNTERSIGTQRKHSTLIPPSMKGKGREETDVIEIDDISSPSPPRQGVRSNAGRQRRRSPSFEVDLDLTTPSPPARSPIRSDVLAKKHDREASPVWDIELDLNPSDDDDDDTFRQEREPKRRRV